MRDDKEDTPGSELGETLPQEGTDAASEETLPQDPESGGVPPPTFPASATDGSIRKEVAAGSNEIDIPLVSGGE